MHRFGMSRFVLIIAALALFMCAPALAEGPVTSLSDLYDGGALCKTCYGPATLEISSSSHGIICQSEGCSAYGVRYNYTHSGSCVDSSVCGVCGAEYTGSYTRHVYDGGSYTGNDDYHWQPCVLCGDEEDSGWNSHSVSCKQPDECSVCGMDAQEDWRMIHNRDGVYLSDENSHWQTCLDCGQPCNVGDHWGSCEDKLCDACGSAITDSGDMSHSYDYDNYVACPQNPEMHGYACTREGCGHVSQNGYHYAICTAPGVCDGCGVEFAGSSVRHSMDYDRMVVHPENPNRHGYACTREGCGYVSNNGSHYAWCGAPGVCDGCGVEYTGSNVEHDLDYSQMIVHPDNPDRHGYACTREGCGYVQDDGAHYAECDVPGVCGGCGVEYSGSKRSHELNWDVMVVHPDNPARHGYACVREGCGYVEDNGSHSARCDAPGVCRSCGVEYTGRNVSHSYNYDQMIVLPDNPAMHGYVCTREGCGYVSDNGTHYARCDAPGVCAGCGTEGGNFRINHSTDWDVQPVVNPENANEHGRYCTREGCGAFLSDGEHYAYCNAPGVCYECGAECDGSNLNHDMDWDMPMVVNPADPDEHGRFCSREGCGYFSNYGSHSASCDQPGVCYECGAVSEDMELNHSSNRDMMTTNPEDPDEHGWYCTLKNCGVFVVSGRHSAECGNPGVCSECGADYDGGRINHSYDYNSMCVDPENAGYHGRYCTVCGEFDRVDLHYARCDAPGVCAGCGVEYTGGKTQHDYNWNQYVPNPGNPAMHGHLCTRCGEYSNDSYHQAACDAPGVCMYCGVEYTGNSLEHEWLRRLSQSESCHRRVCSKCGEMDRPEEHRANCGNPGVCAECGYEKEGMPTNGHSYYSDADCEYDADSHWRYCADCGVMGEVEPHSASCAKPGVCADCGAEYTGSVVSHNVSWDSYVALEDGHGRACEDCGKIVEFSSHYADCEKPGVCDACGWEGGISRVECDWDNRVLCMDENYHWYACSGCGSINEQQVHYDTCYKPGICAECGVECEAVRRQHCDSRVYAFDEYEHWSYCPYCGEEDERNEHWSDCLNPGVCRHCGAENCSGHVSHEWNHSDEYLADATHHWYVCRDCGGVIEKQRHLSDCTNPGVCRECGVECSSDDVSHDMEMQSDETHHWLVCVDCGEVDGYRSVHRRACGGSTNVCMECGAAYDGEHTEHVWDWEDGEYYAQGLYHWRVCMLCETPFARESHYSNCLNPGVCVDCGAEYSLVYDDVHRFYDANAWSDEAGHWNQCSLCGAKEFWGPHWAYCTNPEVCVECGMEVAGDTVEIQHDSACTPVDQYSHAWTCACGEEFGTGSHEISCSDPTKTCWTCGMTGAGGTLYHSDSEGLPETDAYSHWFTCESCEQVSESGLHLLDCKNPTVCLECGTEAESGRMQHTAGEAWKYDDNRHWHECTDCGEEMDGYTHLDVNPTDGACDRCGYTVGRIGPYLNLSELEMLLTGVEGCGVRYIIPYNPDGENAGPVKVVSSDASVVSAELRNEYERSARYLLTPHKEGTAVLTLTSPNGMTKDVTVTVRVPDGSLMIPENTATVAEEAFIGTDAEFICVPEGVTAIGDRAFANCGNLKEVYIPGSAAEIGANLFSGCTQVRVYMPENSLAWYTVYGENVSVFAVP